MEWRVKRAMIPLIMLAFFVWIMSKDSEHWKEYIKIVIAKQ